MKRVPEDLLFFDCLNVHIGPSQGCSILPKEMYSSQLLPCSCKRTLFPKKHSTVFDLSEKKNKNVCFPFGDCAIKYKIFHIVSVAVDVPIYVVPNCPIRITLCVIVT